MASVQKSKKKKISCIVILVIVLALIGFVIWAGMNAMKTMQLVTKQQPYGEAEIKDLSSYVNVSGTVSSSSTVNVTAEVLQKVVSLNVKVGDAVKKGDVICQLDSTELQEKYDKLTVSEGKAKDAENYKSNILRRNLDEARTNRINALNKAQQAINDAETARDDAYNKQKDAVDRYNQLVAQMNSADAETQEQLKPQADALEEMIEKLDAQLPVFDDAVTTAQNAYQTASDQADMAVQAAQDAIDAEQYTITDDSTSEQLKLLREQIDACTVTATEDGVVTQLNVTEGSVPLNNNIAVIENTDSLVIRGKVNEADILRIEEGMECEIKTSATDEEVIPGKVSRIERIISSNDESAAGGYTVEISIGKSKSKLLIGMSANVKIVRSKKEHVLSVPYDAIMGGENEGYSVFVGEPTGTAGTVQVVKKPVKIGFEGDFFTEITEGDIKEGDLILIQNFNSSVLEEGQIIPDPKLMKGLTE